MKDSQRYEKKDAIQEILAKSTPQRFENRFHLLIIPLTVTVLKKDTYSDP